MRVCALGFVARSAAHCEYPGAEVVTRRYMLAPGRRIRATRSARTPSPDATRESGTAAESAPVTTWAGAVGGTRRERQRLRQLHASAGGAHVSAGDPPTSAMSAPARAGATFR